jgi:hypothetical protein
LVVRTSLRWKQSRALMQVNGREDFRKHVDSVAHAQ